MLPIKWIHRLPGCLVVLLSRWKLDVGRDKFEWDCWHSQLSGPWLVWTFLFTFFSLALSQKNQFGNWTENHFPCAHCQFFDVVSSVDFSTPTILNFLCLSSVLLLIHLQTFALCIFYDGEARHLCGFIFFFFLHAILCGRKATGMGLLFVQQITTLMAHLFFPQQHFRHIGLVCWHRLPSCYCGTGCKTIATWACWDLAP